MSNQDQSSPNDKPNETTEKNNNEKKKRTIGWDRIRETVNDSIVEGALCESPTSSSPSSTRSTSTPKPGSTTPVKKQTLNPFMRNQPMSTLDVPNNEGKPSLSDTTLVAAKAAGLTNFSKNFRTPGHKNGVIYATSTAVQQDIYRLKRDLEKLLEQLNPLAHDASFSDSKPSLTENTIIPPPPPPPALERYTNNTFNSSVGKRSVFHKQPVAEMFQNNNTSSIVDINELVRDDASRISSIMSSIMDLIVKHKSATRLPLTAEILAVLAVPFDKSPLIGTKLLFCFKPINDIKQFSTLLESDCMQALDIFEYIKDRFTALSISVSLSKQFFFEVSCVFKFIGISQEHFEQISFCCRLLGAGDLKTKVVPQQK